VLDEIANVFGECSGKARIAPQIVSHEVLPWFARLVTMINALPLIVEDVSIVMANICDLYFATVFRICAGESKNEKLLLGIDDPAPFTPKVKEQQKGDLTFKTGGSPLFGFRTGSSSSLKLGSMKDAIVLPAGMLAEICSPTIRYAPTVAALRDFMIRAQTSVKEVSNFEKSGLFVPDPVRTTETAEQNVCNVSRVLEKRLCAARSCTVVAALADAAFSTTKQSLATPFFGERVAADLHLLEAYIQTILEVSPTLSSIASDFACIRSIPGSEIVNRILQVGVEWKESNCIW
jgi:hypothetical protein